jgi:hypothetical protein
MAVALTPPSQGRSTGESVGGMRTQSAREITQQQRLAYHDVFFTVQNQYRAVELLHEQDGGSLFDRFRCQPSLILHILADALDAF